VRAGRKSFLRRGLQNSTNFRVTPSISAVTQITIKFDVYDQKYTSARRVQRVKPLVLNLDEPVGKITLCVM
jgi:hypothetical protein